MTKQVKLYPCKMAILKPDGNSEIWQVELPEEPGYDRLKDLINPVIKKFNNDTAPRTYFEHVSVWHDFEGDKKYEPLDMFVDDTGLLKGFPRNEPATTIYRRANLMNKSAAPPVSNPEQLSFIAGTAIVFSRRVWF